jgi:NAD(P)-dependent dehydrogenase (short-subunit alcohol dehydrogenase family)
MGLEAKEAFFDPIRKRLPLGRIAAPEEIAEAYLFAMKVGLLLCYRGNAASYINIPIPLYSVPISPAK